MSESWLDLFSNAKASSVEVPVSDHLPLVLHPSDSPPVRYYKSFKFENYWLSEKNCREVVTKSWENSHGLNIISRLTFCSSEIWRWGKNLSKKFQHNLDHYKQQMQTFHGRNDPHGVQSFKNAQRNYLKTLDQQCNYWRQRAKIFWLKGGDINSRFFHNSVKNRRRNNRIIKLKDSTGKWLTNKDDLGALMLNYFENLFTSAQGNTFSALQHIKSKITPSHNIVLIRPTQEEEVKFALFEINPDKSPGEDGFNPGFYQHFWDILGSEVTLFCNQVILTGKLPKDINSTQLALIPKKI